MQNLKLARQLPLGTLSNQVRPLQSYSPLAVIQFAIGKVKKLYYGSENPYNPRDPVFEQMVKDEKYSFNRPDLAKTIYLRTKARAKVVEHNKRVRKLDDKIKNGVYDMSNFQNKF